MPVKKTALRLRLTAETAASVWRASGGFSLVRRVWLSSAMMIFHPLDARQCCRPYTAAELETFIVTVNPKCHDLVDEKTRNL